MGLNQRIKKLILITLVMIITCNFAFAESLSYSGRLVNTNGSPVTGPVNLKFELASTADTSVILCSQQISNVALTNGVFHVKLDLNCGAPTLSQVLGAIVAPDAAAIRVTNESASKVYSFQSLHAVPSAQIAHGLSKLNANNNEVLTWTGSKWEPKPVTGATGGTVTDITAGSGLSGGTITNSGTIAIANGGVTDAHLAGNIARSKLANGTANYVLMNNGAGVMSEVAQLPLAQGGTGSNTAAGARTNLGLGDAAVATIGYGAGQVMPGEVPICLAHQKLQMNLGPTFWSCANDNDSLDATKLPLGGGTMSGAIAMGNNQITGLAGPTIGTDAATKDYVDTKVGAAPGDNLGNHTATATLNLGTNKILVGDGAWNTPSISFTNSTNTGFSNNGGTIRFTANGNLAVDLSGTVMQLNGSYAPYMRLGGGTNGATGPTYSFSGDTDTGIFNLATNILGFTTGGVEKMRILATGEVAIGKTTAAGKLDVAGDIALDGKLRLSSDTANFVELRAPAGLAGNLTYTFPASAGTSGYVLTTDGTGGLSWSQAATTATNVGGDLTGTIANAQIAPGAIYNADIANLTITYAKLNILDEEFPITKLSGTSDATKYLKGNKTWGTFLTDVLASTFATVTPSNTAITNGDSLQTVVNKTQGQINNLVSNSSNYLVKNGTDSITGTVTVNAATGALKIPTTPSGVDGTDAANVQYVKNYVGSFGQWTKTGSDLSYSAGNVGIGIASPWDQFMVYKANAVAAASIVSDNTSTTAARYPSIAVKNFGGGGAGAIGNPVIELVNLRGSSSGTAVIKSADTLGGISFSGSTNTGAAYKEGANIRSLATQNFSTTAAGGSLLFATTANSTTTPVDRMIIDQNGKVGVGTLTPVTQLHVKQSAGYGTLMLGDDGGTANHHLTHETDGSFNIFTGTFGSGTNQFKITSAGNIGIGTSAPAGKLHLRDGSGRDILLVPAATGAVNPRVEFRHNDNGNVNALFASIQGFLQDGSPGKNGGDIIFSVGNLNSGNPAPIERMRVAHTGNIGIGTSTPIARLEINSPVSAISDAGMFTISDNNYPVDFATGRPGLSFGYDVGSDMGWIYSRRMGRSAQALNINQSMYVYPVNGSVGIGTTGPAYKLDVAGTIRGWGITDSSDIRLKNTIVPLQVDEELQKILRINSVSYFWNDNKEDKEKQIGFIAQEMEKVYPELVKTDNKGMKSVNYSHLVSPIVSAIKSLYKKMTGQEEQVKKLTRDIASVKADNEKKDKEIAELKTRLDRLEKAMQKRESR